MFFQVAQEQAAMEGLMKMKGVYETNPTLGDPMTVEGLIVSAAYLSLYLLTLCVTFQLFGPIFMINY